MGLRYWDRRNRRAIFVPTDDAGTPLWETSPDKFVEIDPVPMKQQLEWMVDFANDQNEKNQAVLLDALKDTTPGAFKRALSTIGLGSAWRTRLRLKVTEHATEWTARAKLPPTSILEVAYRTPPARTSSTTANMTQSAEDVPNHSDTEQLRARLHQIIDRMGLAELAQIQIPATYLLES